nr:class I SAM-dependent methyltransferase [Desulfobaculum xiamenense]
MLRGRCAAGACWALDLGCGTGGNLPLLAGLCGSAVGLDLCAHALSLARSRQPGALLVRGDAMRAASVFRPGSFDVLTMFNVLYHQWVADPEEVLAQGRELLRPGGALLVTEPAFACLMRGHDRAGMGQRRFTLPAMRSMLRRAGFVNLRGTYFNAAGLLPALVLALWDRLRGGDAPRTTAEISHPPRVVETLLGAAMGGERWLVRRGLSVPVGLTLLCVGERRR